MRVEICPLHHDQKDARIDERCVRLLAATGRAHRRRTQAAAVEAPFPRRSLQQIAADTNVPLAGLSVQVFHRPAPHLADANLALCRLRQILAKLDHVLCTPAASGTVDPRA